jgi:sugar lactone lactonase YvrE
MHTGTAPAAFAAETAKLRVISDQVVTGFVFPESVGCDPAEKVLYVSEFGGTQLQPAEKDGKGRISKVALDGKILVEQFLPTAGEVLHKPKGIWIRGDRLWVTDIDAVWIFDLKTRKGRKLELPGIKFANDPAVRGNTLYVSDNRSDQLFRVEPADFLDAKVTPKVSVVFSGKAVNPNGLYPAKDGSLLIAGFMVGKEPGSIYALAANDELKLRAKGVGRLDGLYEMNDGTLLVTDWNSGALIRWSAAAGVETLASGFKGPADFCVMPDAKGLLVIVPDLPASVLRLIRLGR